MANSTNVARLRDLMREVAKNLEVRAPRDDDEEFSLDFPLEDGRTKDVSAFAEESEDGDAWVMVYSVFGRVDDLDANDLLERNFSPGYTFIAADEGDAMVCASYPLDDLDAESLEALLGDVALWADALQSELSGDGDED
ncbi:MAG: type III secretion system chaperone [Dehalococcoidia bacterium]|nr:type III secretion system chaperone [Dehalococcoidia bacterium]